jgi:hypothetical protein
MKITRPEESCPDRYEIRFQGHLAERWTDWFDGFTVENLAGCGESLLRGPVVDQAALYGILNKIYDLNLKLISVNRVKSER